MRVSARVRVEDSNDLKSTSGERRDQVLLIHLEGVCRVLGLIQDGLNMPIQQHESADLFARHLSGVGDEVSSDFPRHRNSITFHNATPLRSERNLGRHVHGPWTSPASASWPEPCDASCYASSVGPSGCQDSASRRRASSTSPIPSSTSILQKASNSTTRLSVRLTSPFTTPSMSASSRNTSSADTTPVHERLSRPPPGRPYAGPLGQLAVRLPARRVDPLGR